ncbi:methyl-accepting chemotaxis protein [Ferrimonas kyonanensis]|uniref:methyl-accepting chemotaxis protein n=1 Tax=Ferrimonas kyonanensis TaxID=364763 RepID=UPI00041C8F79|nr:methyl-accepting chemotaxis protein [Ferrimonas kyonanensis]
MTFNRKLQLLIALAVFTMAMVGSFLGLSQYRQAQADAVDQTRTLSQRSATDLLSTWIEDHSVLLEELARQSAQVVPIEEQLQLIKAFGFDLVYLGYADNDRIVWSADGQPPAMRVKEQVWFQTAQRAGATVLTAPYQDAVTGKMVVTLTTPLPGSRAGVVSGDLSLATLSQEILQLLPKEQGELLLVDGQQRVIAANDRNELMQPLNSVLQQPGAFSRLASGEVMTIERHSKATQVSMVAIAGMDWQVLVALDLSKQQAQMSSALMRLGAITLVGLLLAVMLASFMLKRLLKPLQDLELAMDDLTHGDGDLTRRLEVVRRDEFGRVSEKLNAFMAQLAQMIVQVRGVAQSMDAQSQSNRDVVVQQSEAIDRQQGKVDQVATAVEEMAMTAHEVANHAASTAEAAQHASQSCDGGQVVLSESNDTIRSLAGQVEEAAVIITQLDGNAQEINKILATIQTIAEQTNLLALNAAIEAARAGDQGRGFAVVADEVRVLSQKTQGSAEEIQQMIETLQANTHRAVSAMNQGQQMAEMSVEKTTAVTDSLSSITSAIEQILSMSEQIAAAAEEQRAATAEVSQSTAGIREDALLLSGQSESVATTAASLNGTAAELGALLAKFKA